MLRLLVFILLFLLFPVSAHAAGACEAPQPNSAQVKQWIQEAQKRGGAAANVPVKVLEAIYFIEATVAYADPASYSCQQNTPGSSALGLMQVLDDTYERVVPDAERFSDEGVCGATSCKLSRCNPVDAMEIAARVLLEKVGLWDYNKFEAKGKISTKEQVYNASCNYYGMFEPDDLTNNLVDYGDNPRDGQQSYCEFVSVYSGFYSAGALPWPRGAQPISGGGSANWKYNACQVESASFTTHPLRPNPDDPISADAPLTTYCAMRPTAVEMNTFDKRQEFINIKTVGNLTQDFRSFITPLLSITDPKKADYSLPYSDKAQRYMADFLEGRAYYEPFVEPTNPTPAQASDLFNRLGVFRKLAPKTYQDELKRALIQRASGQFNSSDNPYGFDPASTAVHDYAVGSWQGQTVTLKNFVNHWAPLPQDYPGGGYEVAYETWKNQDGGKWYQLWPYVPMFTREDTIGTIEIVDSNGIPYSPSGQYIEQNKSNPGSTEVSHPHLARTFEVAKSLSYLLTPEAVHQDETPPVLGEEWMPKLWEDSMWWLDPSYPRPKTAEVGVELGPLCDVDPGVINLIRSSGDTASDDKITTSVTRQDTQVPNPEYIPPNTASPADADDCGANYACETCKEKKTNVKDQYGNIIGTTIAYVLDESACFYSKQVRSNPNYLITYTPFLTEILTSLSGSRRAVFDLFKSAGAEKKPYEEYDWPGVGNAGEESPQYGFSAGKAEAGARKPGDSQSYYYRYLGSLQCAKERVMMTLQPFITGEPYKPYATECFRLPPTTPASATAGGPSHDFDPNDPSLIDTNGDGLPDSPPGFEEISGAVPGIGGGLTFPNTTVYSVASRAYEIVQRLQRGTWNYWNVSPDYDVGLYWCTWLVINSFSENGVSIPRPTNAYNTLYTPTLANWFQSQGKYLDADSVTLDQLSPGMAVFFKVRPPSDGVDRLNHVAIVYSITPGQGFTTVESNAGYKSMFYPVDDAGKFQVISVGSKTISVEGFGKR